MKIYLSIISFCIIGCNSFNSIDVKQEVFPDILTEKDMARTDFPQAKSFSCPEYTSSVYGWSCDTKTYICSNEDCSSWIIKKCETAQKFEHICIDKYEYPGYNKLPEKKSFEDASNICATKGGRICGQKEWQNACMGNSKSPYGTSSLTPPKEECNLSSKPYKAGSKPECRNLHGVVDIIGNGKEWQSSKKLGWDSCVESVDAEEKENFFRCCYDSISK